MTYPLRKLSFLRTARSGQDDNAHRLLLAAPKAIAPARASATLALSMTVALRYLAGRPRRMIAPAAAMPDPVRS